MTHPLALGSFGGGTNSAAMYIGMVERGEPPPLAILMADTGGEKPHTYRFRDIFSEWLVAHGYPPITTVYRSRRDKTWKSLEQECLDSRRLPSVAYGFKACSQKFKAEPMTKWANNFPPFRAEWKAGRKVTKLIGFDWDELGRARFYEDKKYEWRYPLIDWRWGRDACREAIARAGLPQPGKSACFFCPNSKKREIAALARDYPDLLDRAFRMEGAAEPSLRKVKGLGRRFSWRDYFLDGMQAPDDPEEDKDALCGCYDGGDVDDVDRSLLD